MSFLIPVDQDTRYHPRHILGRQLYKGMQRKPNHASRYSTKRTVFNNALSLFHFLNDKNTGNYKSFKYNIDRGPEPLPCLFV